PVCPRVAIRIPRACAGRAVKRLMDVTDVMNDKQQRFQSIVPVAVAVGLKSIPILVQGRDEVWRSWRTTLRKEPLYEMFLIILRSIHFNIISPRRRGHKISFTVIFVERPGGKHQVT